MVDKTTAVRGSARRARTDAALTETVMAQLSKYGYADLTIERVASDSGVAKTTIYRRWASKAEMVFDLVIHRAEAQPTIDTGALASDIHALAARAVALIAGEPGRGVLPGLLADMAGDAELAIRLRQTLIDAASEDVNGVLGRARLRGELADDVPVSDIHAALLGIPYAQVHLFTNTNSTALTATLTKQLLRLLVD